MDPNAALTAMREAIEEIKGIEDRCGERDGEVLPIDVATLQHTAFELASFAEALDGWISRGGFLPRAWAGVR